MSEFSSASAPNSAASSSSLSASNPSNPLALATALERAKQPSCPDMGQALTTFRNAIANCLFGLANGLTSAAEFCRSDQSGGEAKAANPDEDIADIPSPTRISPPPNYLMDAVRQVIFAGSGSEDSILGEVRRRLPDSQSAQSPSTGYTDAEILTAIRDTIGEPVREGEEPSSSSESQSIPCVRNPLR